MKNKWLILLDRCPSVPKRFHIDASDEFEKLLSQYQEAMKRDEVLPSWGTYVYEVMVPTIIKHWS